MSNLRDLLSKANRKHEMRWKVLVFDPKKDNELVDEFKGFECIDCATAKKRELLEKHPDKTIEIIAEAIAKARIDIGNDDIDDAYMDVNYAISSDTNYKLKDFKKESSQKNEDKFSRDEIIADVRKANKLQPSNAKIKKILFDERHDEVCLIVGRDYNPDEFDAMKKALAPKYGWSYFCFVKSMSNNGPTFSAESAQKNEALDEHELKAWLKSEHSRALKNIKNMAANDSSSFFKGYATALHEIQRKFGL